MAWEMKPLCRKHMTSGHFVKSESNMCSLFFIYLFVYLTWNSGTTWGPVIVTPLSLMLKATFKMFFKIIYFYLQLKSMNTLFLSSVLWVSNSFLFFLTVFISKLMLEFCNHNLKKKDFFLNNVK